MTDKVGVLGQASTNTTGSTTVYTVPSGKTAIVKFMYRFVAGVNTTFAIVVNGITIFTTGALTSTQVSCSTAANMIVNNPTLDGNGASDAEVAPGPQKYYLDEGDTIVYTIGTADTTGMNFQVVGIELDRPAS